MGNPIFWAVVTIGVVVYQVAIANTSLWENIISGIYLTIILIGLRQFSSSQDLWGTNRKESKTRLLPRWLSCALSLFSVLPWAIAIWMYGDKGFFRFWGLSLFSLFLFVRGCRAIHSGERKSPSLT